MAHFKSHPIDSTADHIGVAGAVLDSLISFNASGLPKDSGKKISDLALAVHSHVLNDITDVTLTGPVADNEVLAFNFATSSWINQTPAEAGLASVAHTHLSADITDLTATINSNTNVTANTTARHTQGTDLGLDTGGVNPVTALEIRGFIDSKAANNGLAPLDATGKVPTIHLPAALVGAVTFQGTWNATTNVPVLANLGVGGTKGDYYVVSVAGATSIDGITDWQIGDWIIHNGSVWEKVDNTANVTSVNGSTGTVVLTTDNIAEGATNLYYTEARVNVNTNVSANTAARHTQNTDTQLRSGLVDTSAVGEMKVKVFRQIAQPVLSADDFFCFWVDTDAGNKTFLMFREAVGNTLLVELG